MSECLHQLFYGGLLRFVFDGNELFAIFFLDIEIGDAFNLFECGFHFADTVVTFIFTFGDYGMTVYFERTFFRHSFPCSLNSADIKYLFSR